MWECLILITDVTHAVYKMMNLRNYCFGVNVIFDKYDVFNIFNTKIW